MHKYFMDIESIEKVALDRGFRSLSAVAQKIGLHRNTFRNFSDQQSILPQSLTKLFDYLKVDGRNFIRASRSEDPVGAISKYVDALLDMHKDCCIVLFGSRARNRSKKFSDFDLGVYSEKLLSHAQYRALVEHLETVSEDFPYQIQLVNLSKADKDFLTKISPDLQLLGGKMTEWISLKKRAYER